MKLTDFTELKQAVTAYNDAQMKQNNRLLSEEELVYLLNSELGSNLFTKREIHTLRKQGKITAHECSTPFSKVKRYKYVYNEVKNDLRMSRCS